MEDSNQIPEICVEMRHMEQWGIRGGMDKPYFAKEDQRKKLYQECQEI